MKDITGIYSVISVYILVCITKSESIRVKFGTNDGPIVPPTPAPIIVPQPPFRAPAAVWEDQSKDVPNPAPYRPPPFQGIRYTQAIYEGLRDAGLHPSLVPPPPVLTNAQKFVNQYKPQDKPVQQSPPPPIYNANSREVNTNTNSISHRVDHHVPLLGARHVPGHGIQYFLPANSYQTVKSSKDTKHDSKDNTLESNSLHNTIENSNDFQLKYDKLARRRVSRESAVGTVPVVYVQWTPFIRQPYTRVYY